MADVLTIDDLITDKKHSTFFAEVVTGKTGGLSTGADISTSTNQVTGQVQKTLPQVLADLGMVVQTWTATSGGTLTNAAQVFLNDKVGSAGLGNYYAWSGTFPKVVAAGLDPAITAGFIQRSDASLRAELAAEDSDVVISEVRAGDMAAAYKNTPSNVISLSRMFDAVDGSDITSILSSAIAYSKLNGFIPIVIDLKSAVISGPLPQLNSSFDFVSLHGLGKGKTNISIGTAGDGVFTLSGGSGGPGGVVLSGLTLTGGATQKPLKNTGFCGARVRDVYLDCGTAVVLSNNIATGTFTEFFLFDSCELNINSIFEFDTGSGNDSFHGCGLTNRCIVNEKTTSTGLIKVGAAEDTRRTVWYNAPLDAQIFKRTSTPIITTGNSLSNIITTNGNPTVENFTLDAQSFSAINTASRHRHAGTLNSWNGDVLAGSAVFSNLFSTYPNGVVGNGIVESEHTTKATNTTALSTGIQDLQGKGRLASVAVTAGNYEYCFLVFFAGRISPFIEPSAGIVSTVRAFDSAGFGLPTVSVNDYELVISNPAWTGAITVTTIALPNLS